MCVQLKVITLVLSRRILNKYYILINNNITMNFYIGIIW